MRLDTVQSPQGESAYGPFARGLIGAVAMGAVMSSSDGDVGSAAALAAGMGFLAAVFAVGSWLHWWSGFFYSAVALVAFVPTAMAFLRSSGCNAQPPPAFRIAAFTLLIAIAAVSVFASMAAMGRTLSPALGLGLFGALEILTSASTFLAGFDTSWVAMVLMLPAAALLGWFAARATDEVVGVAGVAFAMQTIYAATTDGVCGAANFSGAVLIAMFGVAYFATRGVAGLVVGRH